MKSGIQKMVEELEKAVREFYTRQNNEGDKGILNGYMLSLDMARRLLAEEEAEREQAPTVGFDPGTKDGDSCAYALAFHGKTKEEAEQKMVDWFNAKYRPAPQTPAGLVEELADLEHRRWAHWQEWCHKVLRENCPSEAMEKVLSRWDRQIATEYKDLSEREKEMDRIEARKSIEILSRHKEAKPAEEGLKEDRALLWDAIMEKVEKFNPVNPSMATDMKMEILGVLQDFVPYHPTPAKAEEPANEKERTCGNCANKYKDDICAMVSREWMCGRVCEKHAFLSALPDREGK